MSANGFPQILYVLFTRFVLSGAVVAGLVMGVGWGLALMRRPPVRYTAEARWERLNDTAMRLTQTNSPSFDALKSVREYMMQEIRGRAALEQLLTDLELTKNLPHTDDGKLTTEGQAGQDRLIERLAQSLDVEYVVQSGDLDVIRVRCTDTDPELPPKVVNRLVENYVRRTREQMNDLLINAHSFFARESDRWRVRVEDLEERKRRFESDNPAWVYEGANRVPPAPAANPAADSDAVRNEVALRHEYRQLMRELEDARRQGHFWQDNLDRCRAALTLEAQNHGVRLRIIERASDQAREIVPPPPDRAPLLRWAGASGLTVGVLVLLTQAVVNLGVRPTDSKTKDTQT